MIELKHISKTFPTADGVFQALDDINLTIRDGDIFGIVGMSGAGKSTLVRCINLLERPTAGQVVIDGQDLMELSAPQLREKRRSISMIFQQFNLLMQRTCLRNICFPMEIAGVPKGEARKRALEYLDIVGLPDKANAYPAQLSGGQKQRIAIARALASNPKVLLCDEATSALDPTTTRSILRLIQDINRRMGITAVIITHEMAVVEEICSHVAILDVPSYPKLLFDTDGGMVIAPDLEQKRHILQNALDFCRFLGYDCPKVGVLACVEKLNPKMPETVEGDALKQMNQRGELTGCVVEGPISYDCAVSREIAAFKGFESPCAGDCDVLVAPNIHAGNIMGKMLTVTCKAKMAGFIVGARCPIVMTSRGSSAEEKYLSIVISAAAARNQ